MATPIRVSFSNAPPRDTPAPSSPLVPSSSSPSKPAPLGVARTLSASRRGVIFSPRNHTKYFHSDDSIVGSSSTQVPALKKLPASDPVTPTSHSHLQAQETSLRQSILKSRADQIRIAANVEEGTLNNREPARLLISGKRPSLMARDSFELAIGGAVKGKGKGRMSSDGASSSDDDPKHSDDVNPAGSGDGDGAISEEEEVEEEGGLSISSLVDIVLNGAENLLTLEEAYNMLLIRLRHHVPSDDSLLLTPEQEVSLRDATQPIRDEAPALVRAFQRDVLRLLGKPPSSEPAMNNLESSPFRELEPIEAPPRSRFTPSPSPDEDNCRPSRQGYNGPEIRYRREASGVGAAVIRFLALVVYNPCMSSCFSDVDLQAILEQVLTITRTPRLPTPNPKRTYILCITFLTQIRLPAAAVNAVKGKLVSAVLKAVQDEFRLKISGVQPDKAGPGGTKKEGLLAIANLLSTYPLIFFPSYAELLPNCLRALYSPNNPTRYRAAMAVNAFARAKLAFLEHALESGDKSTWDAANTVARKAEFFVISHLTGLYKPANSSAPMARKDGVRRTEWSLLEDKFKMTVGSNNDVHWACITWASLVTLMGSAYANSGSLRDQYDNIIDHSVRRTTNTNRPLLARVAWNHAIHAYFSHGATTTILPNGKVVRSFNVFFATRDMSVDRLVEQLQMPINHALDDVLNSGNYTICKVDAEDHLLWKRSEKLKRLAWSKTVTKSATALFFAYVGMALHSEQIPAKDMSVINGLPSSDAEDDASMSLTLDQKRRPLLDQTWEKVVYPLLYKIFRVCGIDDLTTYGWDLLEALTSPKTDREVPWSLDALVNTAYRGSEALDVEKDKDEHLKELSQHLERIGLKASDVPSYGQSWIAARLGKWCTLFKDALASIHCINLPASTNWVKDDAGVPLIPVPLSDVWTNLLTALRQLMDNPTDDNKPVIVSGMRVITAVLIEVWQTPPGHITPISLMNEAGKLNVNEDLLRIGITAHLFEACSRVLGSNMTVKLAPGQDSPLGLLPYAHTALGADETEPSMKTTTCAGYLLGQILRAEFLITPDEIGTLRVPFMQLVKKVLCVGLKGERKKILGGLTLAEPFLLEKYEALHMDIWRMTADEWNRCTEEDIHQSQAGQYDRMPTNHTGNLLVSLLTDPWCNSTVDSYWHARATEADLNSWQTLLSSTIQRFKAKKAVVHSGILETLAAHMHDYIEAPACFVSPMTLKCLALAISNISFRSQVSNSQSSPWHAGDNYVPEDFLALVAKSLQLAHDQRTEVSSEALASLFASIKSMVERLPGTFTAAVVGPLNSALRSWMEDKDLGEGLRATLDGLNKALLGAYARATAEKVDIETLRLFVNSFSGLALRPQPAGQEFFYVFDNVLQLGYAQSPVETLPIMAHVIRMMTTLMGELPVGECAELFAQIPAGLLLWCEDEINIAGDIKDEINELYRFTLTVLTEIIPTNMPANSATLNRLLPLYKSRATEMITAFVAFWKATFADVQGLEYEYETKDFLREMKEILSLGDLELPVTGLATQDTQTQDDRSQPEIASPQQHDQEESFEEFVPVSEPHGPNENPVEEEFVPETQGSVSEPTQAQSYDADESQFESQIQSLNQSAEPTVLVRAANFYGSQTAAAPATESSSLEYEADEDVFGPAALAKPKGRKRAKRASKEKQAQKVQTAREEKAKRRRAKVEARESENRCRSSPAPVFKPSLDTLFPDLDDSSADECIVVQPERSYYVRKGLKPPAERLVQDHTKSVDIELEDTDVEQEPEPSDDQGFEVGPTPSPRSASGLPPDSAKQRGSLLSSASRWLSRVPSLFSQNATPPKSAAPVSVPSSFPESSQSEAGFVTEKPRKPRKRKAAAAQLEQKEGFKRAKSTASTASSGSESRQKLVPVVEVPSRARLLSTPKSFTKAKGKGKAQEARNVGRWEADDDEDDDLLLTPASARQQREEEEIALTAAGMSTSQQWDESVSGRFADAPGDPTPVQRTPTAPRLAVPKEAPLGPSPERRTTEQKQLLSTIEDAMKAKDAIEELDFEGTKALLKNLNEMRELAERRILAKVDEIRRGR
ncbi:hypothetical protein L202_02194 [Cryptococcus amylolentus CBS 6039]|uniref:Telomere-associated protein Rif1 N-terminal domain-containing protein n=1 Tax=Cryptococcus amylolentus CBS 6039 TaxID=1295533 RepID=A0A1E3HZT7_9TREE|nr:hypothetical protein L202_02194 [Cryptococcus amylolentus CBS 6039]ODN81830.1 hypothetical protein L202_02194 [Cryptococcus amylolentus CBS 6039]